MNKTYIIPAVLPKDWQEIEEKISLVKNYCKEVQIDICDGRFVPNITWPYGKRDDIFTSILNEERGMPFWQDINYEFDLMINNPEKEVEKWLRAGGSRIIIHAEAKGNIDEAMQILKDKAEIGLALNIDTDLDLIAKYKDQINFVQLMGIDKIGFQGQGFDERVIKRVRLVRERFGDLSISVDGGINIDNARALKEAGANRLTVGSAIFESEDIAKTVKELQGCVL